MKISRNGRKDNDHVNSSPTMFTPWNSVVNKEDNLRGVNDGLKTKSIRAISERFANMAYGFFMGKCAAYPVVANYDRNTWGKYGLVKSMLNSSTGIFSFQFSSMEGLDAMFENGLWFIHNNPLILKKWNPDVNLLKEDVSNVPVWVKLHGVPVTAFSEDGLSAIATKLALIEVRADVELKDNDVLNSVENDVDLGTTGGTSNLVSKKVNSSGSLFWNMESSSTSTTHIIEKIDKVERLIIKGKVTLVDDEGKPVTKVDSFDDHDNEDEVVSTDIDMANSLASKKEGYGTNSLLEQWNESYVNSDYDFNSYDQWRIQESEVRVCTCIPYVHARSAPAYDDDMYEGQDIIQDICDNFEINVRGRKKNSFYFVSFCSLSLWSTFL
ncbi:retrotransposon protein, putative, unclassified [Tanacetum coccineum]